MSIDLRKFVDINIQKHIDTVISGSRDVTVLFTSFGVKNTVNEVENLSAAKQLYWSNDVPVSGAATLCGYISMYFANGGSKLRIYEGYSSVTADDIANLPDEYILVCFADLDYASIKSLAITRASNVNIYGIKEKILFARTTNVTDTDSVKNFAVKVSQYIGAEMTMPAYLSQINVYGLDTVKDYAFTKETLDETTINGMQVSNAQFDAAMLNNLNLNIYLASANRCCGGNCKDGAELTNNFVRIILHQTTTNRLVELLSQKLSSNTGLGKIYNVLSQELSRYFRCGYLSTDKVWSDETLKVVDYAGVYHTIIEKGTPLINGYVIKVLPMSSLSPTDRAEHKAPLVYVIVADQYAIRKITISGEVI